MNQESTYDQHPPDRELGPTVLIVDDEEHARDRLKLVLSQVDGAQDFHILHAVNLDSALDILSGFLVNVVLLDKNLSQESSSKEHDGIEAIPEMLKLQPHLQILMVTGSKDIQDVVRAMNLGAHGYVTKEMPDSLLISYLDRAIQMSTLKLDKVRRDRSEINSGTELGGTSKVFKEVLRQAEVLAESGRPLLMLGESGTGKTALAKWIHERRGRFLKQQKSPIFWGECCYTHANPH